VKESLFSIISSLLSFDGVHILDICAGTGSLGIEALSRGAVTATFIECDRAIHTFLNKNLTSIRCLDRSEVVVKDACAALRLLATRGKQYELILFDPPYNSALYSTVPELLAGLALLKPEGVLVIECSARNPLPAAIGSLVQFDRRVYGDTALELFTWEEK
jgi:16S rRNA (guanine(966)-N(2))-methyltransferase RsmD